MSRLSYYRVATLADVSTIVQYQPEGHYISSADDVITKVNKGVMRVVEDVENHSILAFGQMLHFTIGWVTVTDKDHMFNSSFGTLVEHMILELQSRERYYVCVSVLEQHVPGWEAIGFKCVEINQTPDSSTYCKVERYTRKPLFVPNNATPCVVRVELLSDRNALSPTRVWVVGAGRNSSAVYLRERLLLGHFRTMETRNVLRVYLDNELIYDGYVGEGWALQVGIRELHCVWSLDRIRLPLPDESVRLSSEVQACRARRQFLDDPFIMMTPDDIQNHIHDILSGSPKFWKERFNKLVIQPLNRSIQQVCITRRLNQLDGNLRYGHYPRCDCWRASTASEDTDLCVKNCLVIYRGLLLAPLYYGSRPHLNPRVIRQYRANVMRDIESASVCTTYPTCKNLSVQNLIDVLQMTGVWEAVHNRLRYYQSRLIPDDHLDPPVVGWDLQRMGDPKVWRNRPCFFRRLG